MRPEPATASMPSTVGVPASSAKAASVTMIAGSRNAAIVISRLAPMPPNALAESMAPRTRNTAPSIQMPATAARCESGAAAPPRAASGSTNAGTRAHASTRNGATRNTHDVLEERTVSFRSRVASVQ